MITYQNLTSIHPEAKIGSNVIIEPFTTIYKDVEVGEGTWIGPNVTIMEGARIGSFCKIFPGAVISAIPQDLKFNGEKTLLESGLFYFDEKKKKCVERFKGRLIFPINNISGQPIALRGRIIENLDYLAKYINSPETNFFKKGSNLYNLDLAR